MSLSSSMFSLEKPWLHIAICSAMNLEKWLSINLDKDASLFCFDGHYLQDSLSVFRSFSDRFQFPEYFGNNWDAFRDCILDLDWLPINKYVVLFWHADKILANDQTRFRDFASILSETGEYWKKHSKSFHTIFHLDEKSQRLLVDRLLNGDAQFDKMKI